jgi:uncharacterized membrane protein
MLVSELRPPDAVESRQKKYLLSPWCMLVLAIVGIADAVIVAHSNYTGQPLWCPVIDGCNAVVNSPYSRVFGVPMSYFGSVYYVYMFGLSARSSSIHFRAGCVSVWSFTLRWALPLRPISYTFSSASSERSVATV